MVQQPSAPHLLAGQSASVPHLLVNEQQVPFLPMLLGEQQVLGGPPWTEGMHTVSLPQHPFPPQATCPDEQHRATWLSLPRLRHDSPLWQQRPMGVRMFRAPPQSTGQQAVPALWQSFSQANMLSVHPVVSTTVVQRIVPKGPRKLVKTLQVTMAGARAAHNSSSP
jgi:hypothetical protein